MISFKELLEAKDAGGHGSEKHHVMSFARMNPPTTGHMEVINKLHSVADKHKAGHSLIVSHSQDAKKNPLTPEQKIKHIKRYSPETNVKAASKESPTILHHAAELHKKGIEHLHVVAGSDRHEELHKLLHKYNTGEEHKHGSYNFKSITMHSSGERDPDSEGTSGMSGTKMREHAHAGNFAEFRKGVPSHVSDKHAHELMKDVRHGSGIKEEAISYHTFMEVRMTAAMKLQKAFQREQEKAASERKAGEELLKKPAPQKTNEHIEKVAGGYEVESEHGNKNLGKSKTLAGAKKRLGQVEYFKHMKESNEQYDLAQEFKSSAEKSKASGNHGSYHTHMASHHDHMGQWHERKGRSAAADKEYAKAEEHHEASLKHPYVSEETLHESFSSIEHHDDHKVVSHGPDFQIKIGKEHHAKIEGLENGSRHVFKCMNGTEYGCWRNGDNLHFKQHSADSGIHGSMGLMISANDWHNAQPNPMDESVHDNRTGFAKKKREDDEGGELYRHTYKYNVSKPGVNDGKKHERHVTTPLTPRPKKDLEHLARAHLTKQGFQIHEGEERGAYEKKSPVVIAPKDPKAKTYGKIVSKLRPMAEEIQIEEIKEETQENQMGLKSFSTLVKEGTLQSSGDDSIPTLTGTPAKKQAEGSYSSKRFETDSQRIARMAKEKKIKEEVEAIDEAYAKVETKKYSWGTMKTAHHGASFSVPMHPEHHKAIHSLSDNQEHKFKTEDGRHWTAKRQGDDVHLHSANDGPKTKIKHSDLKEEVEIIDEKMTDAQKEAVRSLNHAKGTPPTTSGTKKAIKFVKQNEEVEQIEERNKENATKRKMMDASRGARFKLNNPVPDAEPEHKTGQAHNKAIGRALRKEDAELEEAAVKPKVMDMPTAVIKQHPLGVQSETEEGWEKAKIATKINKELKRESYTVSDLLQALKEGMWPGSPEYKAKYDGAKQGGGAGVKKGSRYGGSLQKDEPENEEEPASAGRKVGSKSGARKNLGNSKLHK